MGAFELSTVLELPGLGDEVEKVSIELKKAVDPSIGKMYQPMLRIVDASSKKLRSSLVLAIGLVGKKKISEETICGAAAIELLHLASLVHDDIIDGAITRRNIPTINGREGLNQAIVVGDYLFAKAGVKALSVSRDVGEIIENTIVELCEGEALELEDLYNLARSRNALFRVIEKKSGSLISAACQVGALASGMNRLDSQKLGEYGRYFGMTFQLIDDLLDLVSTPKLLGKPTQSDIKGGVYTLPVILGLKGSHSDKLRLLIAKKKIETSKITQTLISDGSIEKTFVEIKRLNNLSNKALAQVDNRLLVSRFSKLPEAYLNWSITNMVSGVYRPTLLNYLKF